MSWSYFMRAASALASGSGLSLRGGGQTSAVELEPGKLPGENTIQAMIPPETSAVPRMTMPARKRIRFIGIVIKRVSGQGTNLQRLQKQAHAEAGRAAFEIGRRLRGPGGAGDIDMREGHVLGPELDEAGAGAGAALARGDVFCRGDLGEDAFLVFLVDRHGPARFARQFAGGEERVAEFFLLGEKPGAAMAERH